MALPAKKVSLGVAVVILLLLFSAASFSVHAHARRLIYVDERSTIQSRTLDVDKKHKPNWGYINVGDREYQAYSVLLWEHPNGGEAMDDKDVDVRRRWYESFLPSTLTDSGEPRLLDCFPISMNGFLAMLTRAEALVLYNKPEVRRMFSHYPEPYITSPASCGFLRQQPERRGASFTRSRPAF